MMKPKHFDNLEKSLEDYRNISVNQIANELKKSFPNINLRGKGGLNSLVVNMFYMKNIDFWSNFERSRVQLKTLRISEKGLVREAISFRAFNFKKLVSSSWETSSLLDTLSNTTFVFAVFREHGQKKGLLFEGITIWNMPEADLNICRSVWLTTKETINTGKIVRELKGKTRLTNFIKASARMCIHVRPHASSVDDTYDLPVNDIHTGLTKYTKHSFWLNKRYLQKVISHPVSTELKAPENYI